MTTCQSCKYYDPTNENDIEGECVVAPPTVVYGTFDELLPHVRSYRPSVTAESKPCAQFKEAA